MDKYKEFQGRDLDECIDQALKWFDAPRESLEIEIIQDAKSGIFGIVGARKAKIRARRAQVAETVRTLLGQEGETASQASGKLAKLEKSIPEGNTEPGHTGKTAQLNSEIGGATSQGRSEDGVKEEFHKERNGVMEKSGSSQTARQDLLNHEEQAARSLTVIKKLLEPLAGKEVAATVSMESGKPRVRVEWEGDAGLLIGREGQTLGAIQYIGSRILSRMNGAPINLQVDVGEYRSRQDDKLRELAFALAEKVRRTGRPLSTRPLSSYHRRVVHLCLQDEADLQTRSTGEGSLKRVLISPRRS